MLRTSSGRSLRKNSSKASLLQLDEDLRLALQQPCTHCMQLDTSCLACGIPLCFCRCASRVATSTCRRGPARRTTGSSSTRAPPLQPQRQRSGYSSPGLCARTTSCCALSVQMAAAPEAVSPTWPRSPLIRGALLPPAYADCVHMAAVHVANVVPGVIFLLLLLRSHVSACAIKPPATHFLHMSRLAGCATLHTAERVHHPQCLQVWHRRGDQRVP